MSRSFPVPIFSLPIIDVSPLIAQTDAQSAVAMQIHQACVETGFFYVTGHGVSASLQQELEAVSRQFFALDEATKLQIGMAQGGRAWRGYFPVGGELTSGKPDIKEGIYLGTEMAADHPLVQARVPLHGANLFPDALPQFRPLALRYIEEVTRLGHALLRSIALSLGLEADYFHAHYTADPLILFRIFNYPPPRPGSATPEPVFGVGEHTDYGLLTILKQDATGGLEVKINNEWSEAPPLPNTFVCNIGDMLDRMTRGLYLSTPHRVRNVSGKNRLSFAFFFDPNFFAHIQPIEGITALRDNRAERWDQTSVHEFQGTYGDYLLEKVAKVFPQLRQEVL